MATPGAMAARQQAAQSLIVSAITELAEHFGLAHEGHRLAAIVCRGQNQHLKAIMQLETAAELIDAMAAATRIAPDAQPVPLLDLPPPVVDEAPASDELTGEPIEVIPDEAPPRSHHAKPKATKVPPKRGR